MYYYCKYKTMLRKYNYKGKIIVIVRDKKSRLDFFSSVQLKFPQPASLGSLTENLRRENKKSSASRLDRKYLWHMIYIIKED